MFNQVVAGRSIRLSKMPGSQAILTCSGAALYYTMYMHTDLPQTM
jgi:hypothetical protein